jgi:hypothetical protein
MVAEIGVSKSDSRRILKTKSVEYLQTADAFRHWARAIVNIGLEGRDQFDGHYNSVTLNLSTLPLRPTESQDVFCVITKCRIFSGVKFRCMQ